MKAKEKTGKSGHKKLSFRQRIFLVLFGLSLFAVLEIVLRLLPISAESLTDEDPFVGFSEIHRLFVPSRSADGTLRLKIAPGKLRWFNPQEFPANKTPGTFRIFTLGGSTTYGHPFKDATSFSGWLRELLTRYPPGSRHYEVINAGGISYASYRVVTIIREILAYQPDLVVVFTGHNEFLEARTYQKLLKELFAVFKARQLFSELKTYRLLGRAWRSLRSERSGSTEAVSSSGRNILTPEVQTMLDRSAGLDQYQRDPQFSQGVFEHFRYNVARMIRLCREAGVRIVFLEPVDNIKDFSPFKSQGRSDLDSRDRLRFAEAMSAGVALLDRNRVREGIERFREARSIDSLYAESSFFLGRALLEAGDTAAAAPLLLEARELDVCPLRAQEPIHDALREETARAGVALLDLPSLFRQRSPGGLIGDEMLIDHIHPLPEGNLIIALELLGWLDEQGLAPGYNEPAPDEIEKLYWTVMDSLPEEYFRHGVVNLAKVLLWAKKFRETYVVLQSQWDQLSGDGEAQYLLASVLQQRGAPQKALEHFKKSLELAPDHLMVLIKLAPLYASLGQVDSASVIYERGLRLYPDNLTLLGDYGILLARKGETAKALEVLRKARELDPQSPGADNNIGLIYALQGENGQALEAFRAAVEKAPEDPQGYFNLGNLYVVMQKAEDAERCFQEALRRNPDYAAARINLGNIYSTVGRVGEAEEQFRQAILSDPDRLEPYINLSLLYRNSGRDSLADALVRVAEQRFPGAPELKNLISRTK